MKPLDPKIHETVMPLIQGGDGVELTFLYGKVQRLITRVRLRSYLHYLYKKNLISMRRKHNKGIYIPYTGNPYKRTFKKHEKRINTSDILTMKDFARDMPYCPYIYDVPFDEEFLIDDMSPLMQQSKNNKVFAAL